MVSYSFIENRLNSHKLFKNIYFFNSKLLLTKNRNHKIDVFSSRALGAPYINTHA